MVVQLAGMESQEEEQVAMSVVAVWADEVVCGPCAEHGCSQWAPYASSRVRDVQWAPCSKAERELIFIKKNETSVKILLAGFPSQVIKERPAILTNRKTVHVPVEGLARA